MISFAYPGFLLLLVLVPFFVLVYFISFSFQKRRAIMFSNFEALERVFGVEIFSKNSLALVLNVLVLCLLIFAVAGTRISTQTSNPFSYVLAVDNSGSMKVTDILPSRLDAAKDSAKRFVDSLSPGIEIAVLEFSGDTTILERMETSKLKIKAAIDSITPGDGEGTDVYTAIMTANNLFEARKNKALILISDGQLNVGTPGSIVTYALKNGIVINTIAVGTEAGGLTDAQIVSTSDEQTLQTMAFDTGGRFFRTEDLQNLDSSFDSILKVKREVYSDISLYLLITAIILFSANWVLYNFRFRTFP